MKFFARLVVVLTTLVIGCRSPQQSTQERDAKGIQPFLSAYQGKVLLLLLGTEGCPGTIKATKSLHDYALTKPKAVSILRLDVPLPGEELELAEEWNHPYPRRIDHGRKVAEALDFFFYPTFYVFDPEGALRYSGGYNDSKVEWMVKEILAERKGQPKKNYSLPMPKVGESAPSFNGTLLDGQSLKLPGPKTKGATLLIFSQTSCSYTVDALPSIQRLNDAFSAHPVSVIVINTGEDIKTIRPIYAKHLRTTPVLWDKDGAISKQYGVDMTPFFFLLDHSGKIIKRGSFTAPSAIAALNSLLNCNVSAPHIQSREAG